MATQIVELTGDEAALLSSLDKVIQKQLEHERRLRDTAEQGDAAGVTIRDAMAKVTAESDKALNGLLRDMKSLGPEGATAAAALREHFQTAGKAGHKSFDQVLAQIKAIDPEAAAAAESAARDLADAANSSEAQFKQMLDELRSLGPEGRQAAETIERDMKEATRAASRGLEDVLDKLEEIDPTVTNSANRVRQELAEAAQFSEREFGEVLDELRSLGPEGRKAAAEIKRELVQAGRIAERSMADVVRKLEDIDPAAAKAASRIVSNMKNAGTQTESVIDQGIVKVGQYAASFLAVNTAVDAIRKLWEQVNEEQQKGLEALQGTQSADRRLLQISNSPEEFQASQQLADNLAGNFGVDREKVRRVLFSGRSEGFTADVPTLIEGDTVVDAEAAAGVAGQLPKLFKQENLGGIQAVSGTLVASQRSRVDFEELAKVIPIAAEGANVLGSGFAENQAAVAVTAGEFGSTNTAAERIKSFQVKAGLDEDLKQLADLTDVVKALRDGTEEDREAFLGESIELNTAYQTLLRNLPEIEQVEQEIQSDLDATAQGGGLFRDKIQVAAQNPRIAAARAEQAAAIRLEISQDTISGVEGAEASQAGSIATEEGLKTENLVTRTFDSFLGPAISGIAVKLGASAEQAAGARIGTSRLFSQNLLSTPIEQATRGVSPEPVGIGGRERADELTQKLIDATERNTQVLESIKQTNEEMAKRQPVAPPPMAAAPALSNVAP